MDPAKMADEFMTWLTANVDLSATTREQVRKLAEAWQAGYFAAIRKPAS